MSTIDCSIEEKRIVKVGKNVIGYLQGNEFIKPVIRSKHQLKNPPAWAIDAEAFDREILPKAKEFVILDKETGNKYLCSVETFNLLKREFDRGYGRQYFLSLANWTVEKNDCRQLTLWGGLVNA
jgi:hypothetical protein